MTASALHLRQSPVSSCYKHHRLALPSSSTFGSRILSGSTSSGQDSRRICTTLKAASTPTGVSSCRIRGTVAMTATGSGEGDSSCDLLIVGPGVLGSHLGTLWRRRFPGSQVLGLTNTANNHASLVKLGLQPHTRDTLPSRKFPFVAFSAPPSGSVDYGAEVAAAVSRWDGSGSFLFTSSMSVCAVTDGGLVTEDTPLVALGAAPGTDKLLAAEAAATQGGGNVLRLVGLYHQQRGAHTFFLKMKDVARPSDFLVNLIHYEDAARLALSVLAGDGATSSGANAVQHRGKVFMGSDNHPVTFKSMMDSCVASGLWPGGAVNFTAPDGTGGKSKVVDNTGTRQALGGWQPMYDSFVAFMGAGGRDVYNP